MIGGRERLQRRPNKPGLYEMTKARPEEEGKGDGGPRPKKKKKYIKKKKEKTPKPNQGTAR